MFPVVFHHLQNVLDPGGDGEEGGQSKRFCTNDYIGKSYTSLNITTSLVFVPKKTQKKTTTPPPDFQDHLWGTSWKNQGKFSLNSVSLNVLRYRHGGNLQLILTMVKAFFFWGLPG